MVGIGCMVLMLMQMLMLMLLRPLLLMHQVQLRVCCFAALKYAVLFCPLVNCQRLHSAVAEDVLERTFPQPILGLVLLLLMTPAMVLLASTAFYGFDCLDNILWF